MNKGAMHSHITGLGVDRSMNITEGAGVVGMESARKAASLFVEMVLSKKVAGKALLILGESGSGKSALAVGISKDLGPKVPFVKIVGSEVFSPEIRRAEILRQALRRATAVRIREIKKVYEGEILEMRAEEKEDPLDSYRKKVSAVHISLKSLKGSQRLTFTSSLYQEILKQKISVGDVVYIELEPGVIKKLGRSDTYASEFDIGSDKYVQLPKGEIFTKKEIVQELSLHEVDVAHTKSAGEDIRTVISQLARPGRAEVPERVREEVDLKISQQISLGAAEVTPGVLFIDEAHTLDTSCFCFLTTAIESSNCPIIILATNRACTVDPSSSSAAPIPEEFLSRLFLIRVPRPTPEQTDRIIRTRVRAEKASVTEEGLAYLLELSKQSSLRYSFALLPLAAAYSSGPVTEESLKEVARMFRSSAALPPVSGSGAPSSAIK